MHDHARRSVALAGALVLAVVMGAAGCSQEKMSAEMKQQQEEMVREHTDWKSELDAWQTVHAQMHEWHAANPSPANADTAELNAHVNKLLKHEEDIANFVHDLEAHEARMQEEKAKPEKDQIAGHAAIWAEHMKLKLAFGGLKSAHEDLAKEHAEYSGADSVATGT